MRRIVTTRRFDKRLVAFVKMHPDLSNRVKRTMKSIVANPFDQQLKTHRLGGSLKECLASSITYGYRVVFSIEGESVYFLDIGSHDDVYS